MRAFSVGLAVLVSLLVPAATAPAQESGVPARPDSSFSAFATGTAVHAEVLRTAVGGPTLLRAGVAVSAASTNSDGLVTPAPDETGRVVQPASAAAKKSYGRGTGLEVAIGGGTPIALGLNLAGVAEAAAPPTAPLLNNEIGPIALDPLVYAALVRGQARPAWSDETCVIGRPSAFGLGYAVDAQVLNLGGPGPRGTFAQPLVAADAGKPADRAVTQSRSFTYLEPNPDGSFGVVSETRQTIAPVTLFRGTPLELTIEVLGEWVLRATASGKSHGARIHYGPALGANPSTPVLRLVHSGGTIELTLQQILGSAGLRLSVGPLLGVAVAEPPRPIATPGRDVDIAGRPEASSDGTRASAAVDVVRVSVLQPVPSGGPRLVELRLGHMEASSVVPAGGLGCRIPVRKDGSPTFVNPGEAFTWTISIPSAADAFEGLSCDLVGISAVDTSQGTAGVKYAIVSASNGGVIDGHTVRWDNLGRYRPGRPPIVLTVVGRVEPDSERGILSDTVEVGASLDDCAAGVPAPPLMTEASGTALRGAFTLEGPMVGPVSEGPGASAGKPVPALPPGSAGSRPVAPAPAVGAGEAGPPVARPEARTDGQATGAPSAVPAKAVRLGTVATERRPGTPPSASPAMASLLALGAAGAFARRKRSRRRRGRSTATTEVSA